VTLGQMICGVCQPLLQQFIYCEELKPYNTGFVRSGNTYPANGATERINEIATVEEKWDKFILTWDL
jgi:hypothetical protein